MVIERGKYLVLLNSTNSTVDISRNLKYIVTGGNDGFVTLYVRIY